MATDDTRERQGFGNTPAPDDHPPKTMDDQGAPQSAASDGTGGSDSMNSEDPNDRLGKPKVASSSGQQPGDSDSTSNDGGSHDNGGGQSASNETSGGGAGAEGSDNGGGATASGDNGGATGGDNGGSTASAGGDDTGAAGGGGGDTTTTAGGGDTATTTGGSSTTTTAGGGGANESDHGPALGLPVIGDLGLENLGGGLIHDAVADTQLAAGSVIGDLQSGGNDLVTDLINGTDQILGDAADHLGLGGIVGDNFVADTAGNLAGLSGVLPGDIGAGLIHDAVADTQSLGTTVLGDLTGSGGSLLTDIANGTEQLANNAVNNLGLGDTGHLIDGATGSLGNGINVADLIGDGPLVNGSVLNGDGAIVNPLSEVTGGLTDGLLGSSTGDGPLAAVGIVENGSPAIDGVLGDTGDGLLSGLGIGQIAKITGANDANGNPAISASAGNNPGDSGPFVNAQAFGDNSASSNNLIDLDAGPKGGTSGSSSDIVANVLGGSADGSNPLLDGNVIGTAGQTLANADVLTSPDQFHFPVLDGAGTDSLTGVLGTDAGHAVASLVPDAAPVVDLGTNPIIDVNLAGDAHAADTQGPLHGTLAGQLLGTA